MQTNTLPYVSYTLAFLEYYYYYYYYYFDWTKNEGNTVENLRWGGVELATSPVHSGYNWPGGSEQQGEEEMLLVQKFQPSPPEWKYRQDKTGSVAMSCFFWSLAGLQGEKKN
ncbi:hypothetical protein E2320_013573 [Naja naja]|nr:hypothetical protein E2320_013573 [Naja naja]